MLHGDSDGRLALKRQLPGQHFIHHDADRIYVGTYMGGLSRYDIRTGKFHNYLKMRKSGDSNMPNEVIYCIKMWEGQLYISSRNVFFKLDPSTDTFTKIHLPPNLCKKKREPKEKGGLSRRGSGLYYSDLMNVV